MTDTERTRRSLLRRGLATVATGAVASSAGCTDTLSNLGGSGSTTPEKEEKPAASVYTEWLPAPSSVGDEDHYAFTYLDMASIESNEDELGPAEYDPDDTEGRWAPLDIDWTDVSNLVLFSDSFVAEADFDRDEAISTLEGEEYTEDSTYEGYTIMLSEYEDEAIAIGDGVVVGASATNPEGEDGDTSDVETIIDTKAGAADRYIDDEDLSVLTEELGRATSVTGRTTEQPDFPDPEDAEFENMVARGSNSVIDGETTDRKWVVVYESEDDADTDALEEWVNQNDNYGDQFDDVDDISYDTRGRLGIITGTSDTEDL